MSLPLFAPASSSSRRSASSASSGWSRVSGKSETVGVGTKRTSVFVSSDEDVLCLGLIGNEKLLVCGKSESECGTTHQGGKFEPPLDMAQMVYVRDPKLSTRFLREPVAEKAWFSSGTLKVMSLSKKSVPEWAEFFMAAKTEAQSKLMGASEVDINARLDFVDQAQQFSTPAKAEGLKVDIEEFDTEVPFSPFLRESDVTTRQEWRDQEVLPEGVLDHIEKLGDAMDKLMEDNYRNQVRELEHYQDIAGDFEKVKAWQEQLDGRIGTTMPIFQRDFPSLCGALDFGVQVLNKDLEENTDLLKSQVEQLGADVKVCEKTMEEWKAAVAQGFQDVESILGKQVDVLEKRQKDLEGKLDGSVPRIRNGVLFNRRNISRSDDGSETSKGRDNEDETVDTLLDLRSRLRRLETEIKGHRGGSGDGGG